MDWVVETALPREVWKLSQKLEEHHRRTTQLQQAVEDRDNRIQAIEYENVGLQGEIRAKDQQIEASQNRIAKLVERYVDYCRNPSNDNIVLIARKHTTPENDKYPNFPYYISRIQRRKQYVKLRWLEWHFPDHEVIVEIDNPNSIHAFNRLEEEEHIERKYNHFRLLDLTRDDLYRRGIAAIDIDEWAPAAHRAEPQGNEPTVAFFFVNYRDHKIQTWYILGSFKAPWGFNSLINGVVRSKKLQVLQGAGAIKAP